MPKTELVQKFHVLYLGMTSVSRPIGKPGLILKPIHTSQHILRPVITPVTQPNCSDSLLSSGMDIINGAIDTLMSSTGKEDWTPVILSIADTTLAVIKEKVRDFLLLS